MSRLAPAHFATLATLVLFGACGTTPTGNGGTDILFTLATVDVGRKHSCGLTTSGTAYCWGDNTEGQLGDASNISSPRPVPVAGGRHFVQLTSGGRNHTCGLTANGEAYCWGENPFGQLGDGGTTNSNVPVRAAPGITFANVDAGTYHTCGVATHGTAYCWGSNGPLVQGGASDGWAFGTPTTLMCDNPETTYRGDEWHCSPTPVAIPGPAFSTISAGLWATCGTTPSGEAHCMGWNTLWALGDGTEDHAAAPTPVSGGLSFDQLTLGLHGCGLVGATAYCWGARFFDNGQTGNGTMAGSSTPAPVAGGLTFASVHPNANNIFAFTCGLTTSGEGYCWGNNRYGELGTEAPLETCSSGGGGWQCSSVPVPVAGGIDFISLATGQNFACGVDRNGAGYCWGQNDTGQLGDGTIIDRTVPVRILDPR